MIVSQHQDLNWDELQDISVLTCNVHDCNSQAMMECWTASVRFISEVEASPSCRVLVMLFGRSRSTTQQKLGVVLTLVWSSQFRIVMKLQ